MPIGSGAGHTFCRVVPQCLWPRLRQGFLVGSRGFSGGSYSAAYRHMDSKVARSEGGAAGSAMAGSRRTCRSSYASGVQVETLVVEAVVVLVAVAVVLVI